MTDTDKLQQAHEQLGEVLLLEQRDKLAQAVDLLKRWRVAVDESWKGYWCPDCTLGHGDIIEHRGDCIYAQTAEFLEKCDSE